MVVQGAEGSSRGGESKQRQADLICNVRYTNTLPDIPFDAKFITYPFDPNRFVEYKQTNLELHYKFDLLTEHDMGIKVDLITPDAYENAATGTLSETDLKLLEDDVERGDDKTAVKRQVVSWLRRTEYVSAETTKYGHQTGPIAETKVGYNISKMLNGEVLYKDRDSQLAVIQSTFEQAEKPVVEHPTKRGVRAVESMPVYPDFDLWKLPCAQVIFDSDPAPVGQESKMSQAMIRGMQDESGEQFVAYFLPTDGTVQKRREDLEEGLEYESGYDYVYSLVREYKWNVKNKASSGYEESYFFSFKDGNCYYNELETRVRLSKRKKIITAGTRSNLVVNHRPYSDDELRMQDARVMLLETLQDLPDEEEEEAAEDDEPAVDAAAEDAVADETAADDEGEADAADLVDADAEALEAEIMAKHSEGEDPSPPSTPVQAKEHSPTRGEISSDEGEPEIVSKPEAVIPEEEFEVGDASPVTPGESEEEMSS